MGRVTDVSNHRVLKSEQRPAKHYSLKWWTSNIILCTVFVILTHVWSSQWSGTWSTQQLAHWLGSQCALGLHPIDLSTSSSQPLTSFQTSTPACMPITALPSPTRILTPSVGPLTTTRSSDPGGLYFCLLINILYLIYFHSHSWTNTYLCAKCGQHDDGWSKKSLTHLS